MTVSTATTRDLSRVEFICLVAGLMALNALAIDVMLPALPYMGEALGISHENERQFVVGAYMLFFNTPSTTPVVPTVTQNNTVLPAPDAVPPAPAPDAATPPAMETAPAAPAPATPPATAPVTQ